LPQFNLCFAQTKNVKIEPGGDKLSSWQK